MSSALHAVVTCGPAYAPIDAVRRITNLSSGELGALLCDSLATKNFDVTCFRGEMATHPPSQKAELRPFTTNDSLLAALKGLSRKPDVIFHAAALCDYEVSAVQGAPQTNKIRSDVPELRLTLKAATKILPQLPHLFPGTVVVGWKYELDGDQAAALERGRLQIAHAGTHACVVNGAAYGRGFGLLVNDTLNILHFSSKEDLGAFLPDWARTMATSR